DRLDLTVDGQLDEKAAVSGTFLVPAPSTTPAEGVKVTVTATLGNATGTGPKAEAAIDVNEPRRPPQLSSARAQIWTSRGDGAGGTELALSWPAQPAAVAYRVYIADEQAITGGAVGRGSRAARATDLFDLAAQAGRERYRLLTDPPFVPPPGSE